LFSNAIHAQEYKSAIGLRLGYPVSVSYKTFLNPMRLSYLLVTDHMAVSLALASTPSTLAPLIKSISPLTGLTVCNGIMVSVPVQSSTIMEMLITTIMEKLALVFLGTWA
jgi:hypothetical protein